MSGQIDLTIRIFFLPVLIIKVKSPVKLIYQVDSEDFASIVGTVATVKAVIQMPPRHSNPLLRRATYVIGVLQLIPFMI